MFSLNALFGVRVLFWKCVCTQTVCISYC